MDIHDITQEMIIEWATDYASDDELESTAKALYSVYVQHRKVAQPDKHITNRKSYKQLNSNKSKKHFRYPKGYRKYEKPLEQNKTIPVVEYRK